MRGAVVAVAGLFLLVAFPVPGGAAGAETVRYLVPTGVVDPYGDSWVTPVSVRPCDVEVVPCAEPIVVGTPVFVISEPAHRTEVRFWDDFHGDRVPVTVCVDNVPDGVCQDGTTFGPYCYSFIIWVWPVPAETVIYAHAASLEEPGCGGTKGYASASWS